MPLLSLDHVTRTLVDLLAKRIPQYSDYPGGALTVSPAPPDLVTDKLALSFYLYHAREDAHTKSQEWGAEGDYPLRFKPMGITLHYVLTPRSDNGNVVDSSWANQLLFGLALKTLHDYPYIDDSTTMPSAGPPELVLFQKMRGHDNRLRIVLRPTPPEEATQFWSGGSQPMRLAAYYEVAATLLEPDELQRRTGRVFMYGVHTFVRGKPIVEGTRNTISFVLPGELTARTVEASPASVEYGQGFEVFGADLKGDTQSVFLDHVDFTEPLEILDATWKVVAGESRITAIAQATVTNPVGPAHPVIPGIYDLSVRTVARRTLPDGSSRDFDFWSNKTSIAIAPRILGVAFAAGLGTIALDSFDPAPLTDTQILVFAGSERLQRVAAAPIAGQFRTQSPNSIEFRLPAGTPAGSFVPLRVIARGAESAPRWEEAP